MFKTLIAAVLSIAVAFGASAATHVVNPGPVSAINTAINGAAAGDTILVKSGAYSGAGINLNRSVTLAIEGGTTFNGGGNFEAVSVMCSDCSIIGLAADTDWANKPQFLDYAYGIQASSITGRNNVTIRNIVQRRTNYGFWISGDNWKVEWCEVDRIIKRDSGGDADYGRIFGRFHLVKRNWFHGTNISSDISPGHTDALQYYNQNGEILQDVVIEENLFTDYVQAFFIGNETGNGSAVQRVTFRNNVLWGTRNWTGPNPGNIYLGAPSWHFYLGKNGPERKMVVENNTSVNSTNHYGIITGTDAVVQRNIAAANGSPFGTTWVLEGTNPSLINTAGRNIRWNLNPGYVGEWAPATDVVINPMFANPNDTEGVGPDGFPFTEDDSWRVTSTDTVLVNGQQVPVKSFGAQIPSDTTPPPPVDTTPPVITLIGGNPITLAFGAAFTDPGATVTDNVDATRTIQGTGSVNTGQAGTYTLTYSAMDAAQNVAQAVTRSVVVQAAPNTRPSVTIAPVGPFTLEPAATGVSVTVQAVGSDAEGPVTYKWTDGPSAASWSWVQPASTVTRTVTVTDSGGLTATASVTVVVNPAPVSTCGCESEIDALKAMIQAQQAEINTLKAWDAKWPFRRQVRERNGAWRWVPSEN